MSSSRLLARNTVFNLVGQIVPMLAAVVCIPILIHHLGAARFGVLTLVWAAVGYFSLFDLGLGRALTQAVAQHLAEQRGDSALGDMAWSALWLMFALGVVGALVLAALGGWIVHSGLNVPPSLQGETLASLHLLLFSLPFVVSTAGLRGILEAHQHFGLATALRIPLALFTFVAPLAVIPFSTSLVPIVALLCAARLLGWAAHGVVCLRHYPALQGGTRFRARGIAPLARIGGWMTVSNVVSPLMSYLDRFLIGAILPLAEVAYYVTPYEVVTKLMVLPAALIGVLFPAFAASFVRDRQRTGVLLERAVRAVLLQMFPIVLLIVLFAREGLAAWVGPAFAAESTPVLQWLAIGVFANALAQVPFAALQGVGRPDLPAKLHVLELPLYVAGLSMLARSHGISGVAAAWTLRVVVDMVALFVLAGRVLPEPPAGARDALLAAIGGFALLGGATLVTGTTNKGVYALAVVVLFVTVGWTRVVRPAERAVLQHWSRAALARTRRTA